MPIYLTEKDAVFGLHKKGYVYDFQLVGNDLLWVQEKKIIRAGDFIITACYKFCNAKKNKSGLVILGIDALYTNLKGILIRHYTNDRFNAPPVIIKKLRDMDAYHHEKHFEIIKPVTR